MPNLLDQVIHKITTITLESEQQEFTDLKREIDDMDESVYPVILATVFNLKNPLIIKKITHSFTNKNGEIPKKLLLDSIHLFFLYFSDPLNNQIKEYLNEITKFHSQKNTIFFNSKKLQESFITKMSLEKKVWVIENLPINLNTNLINELVEKDSFQILGAIIEKLDRDKNDESEKNLTILFSQSHILEALAFPKDDNKSLVNTLILQKREIWDKYVLQSPGIKKEYIDALQLQTRNIEKKYLLADVDFVECLNTTNKKVKV